MSIEDDIEDISVPGDDDYEYESLAGAIYDMLETSIYEHLDILCECDPDELQQQLYMLVRRAIPPHPESMALAASSMPQCLAMTIPIATGVDKTNGHAVLQVALQKWLVKFANRFYADAMVSRTLN